MTSAIIGRRIKEVRKMRKLTQLELQEMAELPHNAASGYETGFVLPNIRTLAKIAHVLKVPSDYLMGLTESTHEKTGLDPLVEKIGNMNPQDIGLVEDFVDMVKQRHEKKVSDNGETDD